MYFNLDFIIAPFLTILMIVWFAFCLLLIFKPHAWIDLQNKHSKLYGFEWRIQTKINLLRYIKGPENYCFYSVFCLLFLRWQD